MSFLQTYYTSCETGLRGSKGFQVNAASEGVTPALLQQVERLGLYVPPVNAPSRPTDEEIKEFPVSLIYQYLGDGSAVLAQAKYLGTDYSGRFGNYFTHSLISLNPTEDIKGKGFLPVEMWGSESWETHEIASTSLLPLEEPCTGDAINPQAVEDFLHEDRLQYLPPFLTAVERALGTGRRIVIVADSEATALWIAAASYALPLQWAFKLTFSTYVKNPYQAEALLVGTTSDSDFNFAPHEIEHQYFVFDFQQQRFTSIPEISDFAAQVADAYRNRQAEMVAGFSRFVEGVSPQLGLEELHMAFACYALISGIKSPRTNIAQVIRWCARYLDGFSSEQVQSLLSGVMTGSMCNREIVEACTELFLAAQDREIQSTVRKVIEIPYVEWLIRDVSAGVPTQLLSETVQRLRLTPALLQQVQPLRQAWMNQLRQTEESTRLCVLLHLGDRLAFLDGTDEIMRYLGKTKIGPTLSSAPVQQTVLRLVSKPGMRDVVYGIGDYLATNVGQPRVFTDVAGWLAEREISGMLSGYAEERKDLNLYFRLLGAQANSGACVEAFRQGLAGARRFGVNLTAADLDNAFAAIWQNDSPTIDEGLALLDMLTVQQLAGTSLPQRFVNLLVINDEGLNDPKEKKLAQRLSDSAICRMLGKKSLVLEAFNIALALSQERENVAEIVEAALIFLRRNSAAVGMDTAMTMYSLVARNLVRVKDEESHRELLVMAYKNGGGVSFLQNYGGEVTASLAKGSSVKGREVARLFSIWVAAERHAGVEASNLLLMEILPRALRNWRAKDLESVDKGLVKNRNAHLRWIDWRENFGQQGMLGRMKNWFSLN